MNVPNWQHHSKKEQKITLKPQAMRDRRAALQAFKKKNKNRNKKKNQNESRTRTVTGMSS